MKKIGIITYHYKNNFGAVLQSYALQTYLSTIGFDAEIIDCRPPSMDFRYFLSITKLALKEFFINKNKESFLLRLKKQIHRVAYSNAQRKKFEEFRVKYLKLSPFYNYFSQDINFNNYSIVITGSDQVWNSIDGPASVYFLNRQFNATKVSYAACRGIISSNDNEGNEIRKMLSSFDLLSVRDVPTQYFVQSTINVKPKIVCDPTMLISFENLIGDTPIIKSKYILVYILGNEIEGGHVKTLESIKSVVGEIDIVVCVLSEKNPQFFPWANKHLFTCSPTDWINLIKFAEYIYTDSYHGIIFSTKFKKQFLAYYTEVIRASRLLDLSKRFNLSKNIVSSYLDALNNNSFSNKIDYNEFERLNNQAIRESKIFIDNIKVL